MLEAHKRFWRNYLVLEGRASRAEFWWVFLVNIFANIIVCIFIYALSYIFIEFGIYIHNNFIVSIGLLPVFLPVFIFIVNSPFISLTVRRLHDVNLSGWFHLIVLIPILGQLMLLVLSLFPGTKGHNKYGMPSDFGSKNTRK